MSPDGSRVIITGPARNPALNPDFPARIMIATIAFDAATGEQLWDAWEGRGRHLMSAYDVTVSPDGSTVFVAGYSQGAFFATLAYDAATGERLWLTEYDAEYDGAVGYPTPTNVAVSPDSSIVYVTGQVPVNVNTDGLATIAYDAASGEQLWVARVDAPDGHHFNFLAPNPGVDLLTVSSDGSRVYVSGRVAAVCGPGLFGMVCDGDWATMAYHASTGDEVWRKVYDGFVGTDLPVAIDLSPDESGVPAVCVRLQRNPDHRDRLHHGRLRRRHR